LFGLQQQLFTEHFKTYQKLSKGFDFTQHWEVKVGQTPHQVVMQEGKVRLLHYKTKVAQKHAIPLIVVFSLINRSYILDLKPGKSIVEKLVQAGFDVYLIDWGVAGPSDQFLTLDDYVNRYMDHVVQYVKEHSGSQTVSMLGYCMGGTMAAMYAALYPESVRNLLLMAAPMDFSTKEGLLYLWAAKEHFNVDKLVDAMGNVPPWLLQSSFNMVKPVQNMLDKYVKFFEKLDDEKFVDDFLTMEYWLNDNVPLAGPVYKQFVKDCFHDNLLIQNKLYLGSQRVDLSRIECPVLSIIAEKDHLVPPQCSTPINAVVSSKDQETIVFPTGHIGLSVSGRAMKELWPQVADWLGQRSTAEPTKPTPSKGLKEKILEP